MRRTQIYLDPTQTKALKAIARQKSSSLSELIREAVWAWLQLIQKPAKDPLAEIIGLYSDKGDPTGSTGHDDIYE